MNFKEYHKVMGFIEAIKGNFSFEIEETFSNGFCYYFAIILKERFGGEIYFNPSLIHFATLINGQMFDVYGVVRVDTDWFKWDEYQLTHDSEKIYKSCILKER